jgi:membrane-associated phospholipid phosphatase
MHFASALLLVLNISNWRWRWIFIVYALLIAFATVAGGEHYFVDVLAAIPSTIAVQRVVWRRVPRSVRVTT